jgi:hypothetical protein
MSIIFTKESIIGPTYSFKISPNASFPKMGIPLFLKGREEGFSFLCLNNYGFTNNKNGGNL